MSLVSINYRQIGFNNATGPRAMAYVNPDEIAFIYPVEEGCRIRFARKNTSDMLITNEEMERIKPLIVKE